MERSGSRHDRVRDVTYNELIQERKTWTQQKEEQALQTAAWMHEVDQLVEQCEAIVREMPPEHAPVIRALQDALMELVAEGEGSDGDVGSTDMECEPCPPSEPTEPEQQQATEQEQVAAAFFNQVAEELAWTDPTGALPSEPLAMLRASLDGCAGGLILTPHQLMWVAAGSHFSRARVRVRHGLGTLSTFWAKIRITCLSQVYVSWHRRRRPQRQLRRRRRRLLDSLNE